MISLIKNGLYFGETESQLPGFAGELQPCQIFAAVLFVAVVRIALRMQQALPGIKTHSIRIHAGGFGNFADFHKTSPV